MSWYRAWNEIQIMPTFKMKFAPLILPLPDFIKNWLRVKLGEYRKSKLTRNDDLIVIVITLVDINLNWLFLRENLAFLFLQHFIIMLMHWH